MRIASIPFTEELRLQDLYSYNILDSERDKDFDDLLEVAAHIYGCPIAAITFIDKERQWFKAKKGLASNIQETSRDISFCSHTILNNEVLVVTDATQDERFRENPLVVDDTSIRFYAGAPIVSTGGYHLGSICVIDKEPRELSREEAKMLQILSQQISRLLELRLKNKLLRETAEEQLLLEKQLLQKTLQDHEAEKKAISTELHENIAQTLAATRFYLELAEENGGIINRDLVRKSRESIGLLVKQVRELSQSITPSFLADVELKSLLTGLLKQFQNQTGMEVKLLYEGHSTVDASIALVVYRIVETQMQNVRRHSNATSLTVNVNVFSTLFLSVKDNGIGFDSKSFQKGGGLNRILSKVESVKGRAEISSLVKGGCELVVSIPGVKALVQPEK